ncbi:MAG: Shedu anti-phage system protein SduA domain-containing protein [Actinomycetes bacterium]
MTQNLLEAAIVALSTAMNTGVREDQYQALFEQHPVIAEVLGYTRAVAQPNLPLPGGKAYIPDFIAERRDNGLADVVDLKLPDTRLLLGRKRREAFTAAMNSYLGQMCDYQDYFDEQEHRKYVRQQYGLRVPSRPNTVLIAGRSDDIDPVELHRQVVRRPGVRIVSFDDVLRELHFERGRHYGRWEDIGGLAFYSILRFRRGHEHRDRYLFEAEGEDGFRMGVCLKGRSQLVLRVHSPLAGDLEVAAAHVEYDRWSAVSCVIGAADSITLLQIRIDDRLVAEQRVEGFDAGSQLFEHLTMGANRAGENGGVLDVWEHMVFTRLPTFQERLQLAEYLRAEVANVSSYVQFSGNQWLATDGGGGYGDAQQSDEAGLPSDVWATCSKSGASRESAN